MSKDQHGLSTREQVEALADQLSACADQLQARLATEALAIGALPDDSPARARRRVAADQLRDAEHLLRQRANSLYEDAAGAIVGTLGTPQEQVMALTHAAARQLRKIALVSDAAGLVAGLLALAGGVSSAHPGAVVEALDTIRTQLKAVKAGLPQKPG